MADITLRGMTWDHARGYDPMVATSAAYMAAHPGVTITWEKRSLQAFADRPIGDMAGEYDLMVIDHPHVGEVARAGHLVDFAAQGRDAELAALAAGSVGASHPSYAIDGGQWGLAIDAATPVACYRPDLLEAAPTRWDQVLDLARQGRVGFALIPINALMTFFGLARNDLAAIAENPEQLLARDAGTKVLEHMREIVALMDPRCLVLDPIGIYEWMGRTADAPAYSPFGYGYTNYSRDGYCRFPLVFADAPGLGDNGPRGTVLGGTGIAVSAACNARDVAVDYAFWIAGADCQKGLFFESGGQPGHAAAWQDPACNAACRNFLTNTRETLETSWVRPRYDGYMGLQDRAGDIVHACLRGEATIPATLDALDAAYRDSCA
ncbi:ABC transporter substrate-binding protein [Paracoccus lutimaris]|uniref:Carbohydrate ABC transporter substrate-binding protein (CUT1 family) n=1 Tax=Paracoccus lutimaris TaxID=1490030 RepID=A0A368Z795_9RHOB|nr:extracellular solute-binding protein [Paracoccus lutimaris]RCW87027.1 carbohydrate ABC transporter substrate-binding protein (CUT1 family) [Paracoccus lutimaris]